MTSAPTDTSGSPGTTGREHDADLGSADLGSVDLGSVDLGSVDLGSVDLGSVDGVDRLRLVLLRLTRRIRTHTNSGITPSQMAVLATIIRHQRATVGQIAEIEHVQPPSVSKIVGTLEKIGYVERSVDPDDRRCAPLVATPAGLAYADEVRAAGRTWLAEQLDELDVIDVAAIQQALPALERLLASQL